MFNFTEAQKFAALTLGKPLVVTAAAGSGKTTVLVARYLELIKTGLKPSQILTVTFTNDAAEQLRHKIVQALEKEMSLSELIPEVTRSRFLGTIHSFCFYLIEEFGSVLQLPPIEQIVSDYQFQVAIEKAYGSWLHSLSHEQISYLLDLVPRTELRSLFHSFYQSRHSLSQPMPVLSRQESLFEIFSTAEPFLFELENQLYQRGLFRFDDLEHLSLELLENHSAIRQRLQSQFKALLIDEFQDTSQNQWALFQWLVGKDYSKLFVVGDPKQSIYSFRHADVSLFSEVGRLAESSGGRVCELSTNFRTHARLIADINRIGNSLFENSVIPFQPMTSGKQIEGPSLTIHSFDCEGIKDKKEAELQAVVSAVEQYQQSGNSLGDLTLLFRMGDRIETYAAALKDKQLAVQCTQTRSLFSHHDILDLVHYLKALANPEDAFSLSAFLLSPWVKISFKELALLREGPESIPFSERVQQSLLQKIDWFFLLSKHPRISLRQALFSLMENSDYFPFQSEAFLEWLKPLTEKTYYLQEVLQDLDLWKREGILFKSHSGQGSADAIKLMTVHASKGLEFENVFLVDSLRRAPTQLPTLLTHPKEPPAMKYRRGTETIMPPQYENLKNLKENLDGEESRRILYVAMTRAKTSLTLFLPKELKGVPQGSWAHLLSDAVAKIPGSA